MYDKIICKKGSNHTTWNKKTHRYKLKIKPSIAPAKGQDAKALDTEGKLHHGSGKFDYGDWGLWI